MSHTISVVWTNDDIRFGQARQLREIVEFLERYGIPGSFFIIPFFEGRALDEDSALLKMIDEARGKGHEFHQHGFRHTAFECGIPEPAMLELDLDAKRRLAKEPDAIAAAHTLERQLEMLASAQQIWRRVFGEEAKGFRPGWGAFCDNFYRALAQLGYEWVSSRIPSMTSWLWNAGQWNVPLHFRANIPTAPFRTKEGLREFPVGGDYGFSVPNDPSRIDAMANLALREFEVYRRLSHPMSIVSHPQGLYFGGDCNGSPPHQRGTGYAVHEKLIPALLESGHASFITFNQLVDRYPL